MQREADGSCMLQDGAHSESVPHAQRCHLPRPRSVLTPDVARLRARLNKSPELHDFSYRKRCHRYMCSIIEQCELDRHALIVRADVVKDGVCPSQLMRDFEFKGQAGTDAFQKKKADVFGKADQEISGTPHRTNVNKLSNGGR